MIDLAYLKTFLTPFGYELEARADRPIFFKRVIHKNGSSLYAFTLILITLDKYTVTIEGFNEILIARAVKADAISINSIEELDALREIVFDDTHDEVKQFELMFKFFEQQLDIILSNPVRSDEHQEALNNIEIMVNMAKAADIDD